MRDEKRVVWDLHEHRAIEHGYATTSYRSQGRTVDTVFALASAAEARRGLYVDVTRAREDVTIAYGKDEVQDFGELLVRAQRDTAKCSCEMCNATSTCASSAKKSASVSATLPSSKGKSRRLIAPRSQRSIAATAEVRE